jgi:hypothetical protein
LISEKISQESAAQSLHNPVNPSSQRFFRFAMLFRDVSPVIFAREISRYLFSFPAGDIIPPSTRKALDNQGFCGCLSLV